MIKTLFIFILSLDLYSFGLNQVIKPEKNFKQQKITINNKESIKNYLLNGNFSEVKKFLISNKKYIYAKYSNNENLIHLSVKHRKYELTKFLLRYDFNLSEQNVNGNTPVHLAIYNDDLLMLGLLAKNSRFSKTLGIKNYENLTPVELAKKSKNIDIKKFFDGNELLNLAKNVPNYKNSKSTTKDKRSVQRGNEKIYIGN